MKNRYLQKHMSYKNPYQIKYRQKNSMTNIRDQIKSEDEQFMKIQPKQISEQSVPMIKAEKNNR